MENAQLVRYGIFIAALLIVLAVAGLILSNIGVLTSNLPWILVSAVILFVFWKADVLLKLKEYERAVIMRLGKVVRIGGPGWALVLPFIEEAKIVDLREVTIDIPRQNVIIKDSIELNIDAIMYLRVRPEKEAIVRSVVAIADYRRAIINFISSRLRDIVGGMDLETVIANVDEINKTLSKQVEEIGHKWGIAVDRVEIKDINLPENIMAAMHAQKAAVQEKLARQERAEANKLEIDAVNSATKSISDKTLSYYYLKALEEMSRGKSTKLIFPLEMTRLAQSLSDRVSPKTEIAPELVDHFLKKIQKKRAA